MGTDSVAGRRGDWLRSLLACAAVLAAIATSVGCGDDDGSLDGGPDAALDGALDATYDAPNDGSTDAANDAGEDAGVVCGPNEGPPSWLAATDRAHHRIARAEGRDVHVWAFADGLVRLRYVASGTTPNERSFARAVPLDALAPASLTIAHDDAHAYLCTPEWRLSIALEGGRARLVDASGHVLVDDLAEEEPSPARVMRASPSDELVIGLGEKTGPLDRRGRRFVMRNTDAYETRFGGYGPDADPLYLSIPFYLALRGDVAHGVLTDVAYRLDFDVAATHPERLTVESAGPELDQWIVLGPHPREILRRYSSLTGRSSQPPRWALGFHQSRWGYQDAARIERLADDFRTRGVPADALWLDIQHMEGFRTFTFDPERFADPEALASYLEDRDLRMIVIADPGLKVDESWPIYHRVIAEDLALTSADGTVHVDNAWPGRSVFPDFSLPAARDFWADEVAGLAARGVDGIWLDVNEPTTFPESGGETTVPDALVVDGDGLPTTMAELHNVYASLQARATHEGLRRARPDQRPFVLSRAGFAGIQRWAAVWTGDAPSTWWSLDQVLPMLLGMSVSGVPFVGSDVGGYSGNASPELYARWIELGAWSPFFRGHVTNGVPDQEPWSFGIEVGDIARETIRERYAMLPYLESLFDEHVRTGLPVLRPFALELFEEVALRDVGDQAMLGPFVMIAPVTVEGAATRRVRIPSGRWFERTSGAIVEGPATIDVALTLAANPTFVREGAILPVGVGDVQSASDTFDALRLELYPAERPSSFVLYEDAGDGDGFSRTAIGLRRTETGAQVTFAPREGTYVDARPVELRVWRVDGEASAVRVGGRALDRVESVVALDAVTEGWAHDRDERTLRVKLARLPSDVAVELDYDPTITELAPPVLVELEVTLPAGTPEGPISVASDATGWTHQPLTRVSPTLARGTLTVPRGTWFFYKYARGGWETVEKWPGCAEASNRYGFGRVGVRRDTVFEWRDVCE